MNVRAASVTSPRARDEIEITVDASRRGYQIFAPFYDAVFGLTLHHGRRLAIDALDCRPGDSVLELAIGSGLSLPLYPPGVRVTGIDASRAMLDRAARRMNRRPPRCAATLFEMEAGRLSFPDASFDKAIVLYAMAGLSDPAVATRELQRVCRPGAKIVIVNHFRSRTAAARMCDVMLAPIYRLLRYRADLDMETFMASVDLEVIAALPANLFGYSTVLVCRNR